MMRMYYAKEIQYLSRPIDSIELNKRRLVEGEVVPRAILGYARQPKMLAKDEDCAQY